MRAEVGQGTKQSCNFPHGVAQLWTAQGKNMEARRTEER